MRHGVTPMPQACGVAEPSEDDIELAHELLAAWSDGQGTSKSELERKYWNDGSSHGRCFDRFIRQALGLDQLCRTPPGPIQQDCLILKTAISS